MSTGSRSLLIIFQTITVFIDSQSLGFRGKMKALSPEEWKGWFPNRTAYYPNQTRYSFLLPLPCLQRAQHPKQQHRIQTSTGTLQPQSCQHKEFLWVQESHQFFYFPSEICHFQMRKLPILEECAFKRSPNIKILLFSLDYDVITLYLDTAFHFLFKMILLSSKGTQQLPFTGHLRSPEQTMPQGFSETQEFQKQSTLPLAHKMRLIRRMTQMYKKKKGCLIIFCNGWLLDGQNTLRHFLKPQTTGDFQQRPCVKCCLLITKTWKKNFQGLNSEF